MASKIYQYRYPHPAVTADAVVFGYDGRQLHLLLIERGIDPFKGSWALPGGFMKLTETIEQCARRELREETGVADVYLEQFHVFSAPRRDPRERVVTVAFFALVRKADYHVIAADDAANASWFPLAELPPLAFDHADIIAEARVRLKEVLKVRPIAFRLLDEKFSMSELQRLYEIINDTTYDRRNFARKMLADEAISFEGVSTTPAHNRFPNLYSYKVASPIKVQASRFLAKPTKKKSATNPPKEKSSTKKK